MADSAVAVVSRVLFTSVEALTDMVCGKDSVCSCSLVVVVPLPASSTSDVSNVLLL